MNEKEIEKLRSKIIKLQNKLEKNLSFGAMDDVYKLVELNLLLELECNR
jgi:hypothetical protein